MIILPEILLLEYYKGNYELFISAVYEVFENDFIKSKLFFRGIPLRLKWHPKFHGDY